MTQQTGEAMPSDDRTVKDDLKNDAQSIKQTAQHRAETEARRGRDRVVGTARATGDALDSAADELRHSEQAPDWLASALGSVSSQIQQLAAELDGTEPREMKHSVERFGREKPAMFLAASAAMGFAAGRYLRAGAEQHDDIDAVEPGSQREGGMSHGEASHRPVTTWSASGRNEPVTNSEPVATSGGQIR